MRSIFVACFLVVCLVSTGSAIDPLTFALRNGDTLKSAVYKISKQFQTVEITIDGKTVTRSFSDVASIRDKNGTDLTFDLIRRNPYTASAPEPPPSVSSDTTYPAPPIADTAQPAPGTIDSLAQGTPQAAPGANAAPTPAVSRPPTPVQPREHWQDATSEQYRVRQRPEWGIIFRGGPSYTFPLGSYYKGLGGGMGFNGSLMIPITRNIGIGLAGSYARLSPQESEMRKLIPYGYTQLVENSVTFSTTTVHVTAHYYGAWKDKKGYWDFITGVGFTSQSSSGYIVYVDPSTHAAYAGGFTGETKFSMPFGFGLSRMFSRTIGWEAQTMFNFEFIGAGKDQYGSAALQYAYLWEFRLGLILAVPHGH